MSDTASEQFASRRTNNSFRRTRQMKPDRSSCTHHNPATSSPADDAPRLIQLRNTSRIDCRQRHDIGRDTLAVQFVSADAPAQTTTLLLDTTSLCALYAELRRFLGEFGAPGPRLD